MQPIPRAIWRSAIFAVLAATLIAITPMVISGFYLAQQTERGINEFTRVARVFDAIFPFSTTRPIYG